MANFSPASETNPLKIKLSIIWRGIQARGAIQPGLKILARYFQIGLGFSARPNGPENLKKSHVIETEFQPRLKSEVGHAHQETRWLQLVQSKSDFSGIKETK